VHRVTKPVANVEENKELSKEQNKATHSSTERIEHSEDSNAKLDDETPGVSEDEELKQPKTYPVIRPLTEDMKAKYLEIGKLCIAGLLRTMAAPDWKAVTVKDDVVISKREPKDSSLNYFKGVGDINATSVAIKDVLKNVTEARRYDALFKKAEILQVIDEQTEIIHLMYQTRMCLLKTARDFCILYYWIKRDDGTFIMAGRSIETDLCPSVSGYTRGEVLESGFVIQPK